MNEKAIILAVDDASESLLLLSRILAPEGYQVRTADSGELALAAVAAHPPDLILLDIRMKGIDGLEVCRRLGSREETRLIPVILISALADVREFVEGIQLGAVDFIAKPFQAEELLMRIKTHLSLRQANVSLQEQAVALRQANQRLQCEIAERMRAEAEKEKLESQNRQLQKSESLGRMAGAIAHHFNNQLQAVMMNLQMAMGGIPRNADLAENLAEAMKSARKAAEVSSLMLTYLGQTHCKLEPLDLSDACQRGMPMLRAAVPQRMVLETDFIAPGPIVLANLNQMQQILNNLISNAWEAAGDRPGVIRLAVKPVAAADIPRVNRFPVDGEPSQENYACLEVADSGCGIEPQEIEKIFDPFYSKKFTGRGLGLPVVLGIVRAHHGVITVESKPEQGSVFRVYIPATTETLPAKAMPASQAPETERGGTVLVVDDEESLRKAVANAIRSLGFNVLSARDGVEAVEIFSRCPDPIRLVVCDLTMPRMDGWQTLAALRQLAPGIPVLLCSGYSEAQAMAGDHAERPQAFLSKPFEFEKLSDTVLEVLSPRR